MAQNIVKFELGHIERVHGAANRRPSVLTEVIIQRSSNGDLIILSEGNQATTLNLLDNAMEAIDGQRLPPN